MQMPSDSKYTAVVVSVGFATFATVELQITSIQQIKKAKQCDVYFYM